MSDNQGNIVIYQTEDGNTRIEVKMEHETVWLSQAQIATLFAVDRTVVTKHLGNIFKEGELDKDSVCANFAHTAEDGKTYQTQFYNLDAIISVGYRIKSIVATHFRRWATERLKEYIIKGFTMDDERLKQLGGGRYWKELLDRIRDIRSSEKVLYRQVLDLYATSVDYDPKSDISIQFFKIVQNKLHFAAHGHTAAEIIYKRADSDKPFMGLTTFSGELPTGKDITVAKNYLTADELKILNNLVSGYFDFAEIQAMRRNAMYMSDYVTQLDNILSSTGEKLLTDAGQISHQQAMDKAKAEYRKYQVKTISSVEQAYLDTIKALQKKAKKKGKEDE